MEEYYKVLSERLGEEKYFSRDEIPSILDAYAFGHLCVHVYVNMNDSKLSELVCKYKNLKKYVDNLLKRYFDIDVSSKQQNYLKEFKSKEEGALWQHRWVVPTVLFAGVAGMILRSKFK